MVSGGLCPCALTPSAGETGDQDLIDLIGWRWDGQGGKKDRTHLSPPLSGFKERVQWILIHVELNEARFSKHPDQPQH